jgi:FkbM family methyltransferase
MPKNGIILAMISYPPASHENNLVFDIGLNTGQDTANYLDKGYRVVAVEANPQLVEHCEKRFEPAIDDGQLTILSGAIVPGNSQAARDGFIDFYPNDNDAWGTVASTDGSEYSSRVLDRENRVRVPVIDLADALAEHGVPHYMKVDIEGADIACLEALSEVEEVPPYFSMESDVDSFKNVRRELTLLKHLGYTSFQVVNQKDVAQNIAPTSHFEYGGSGDFGEWLPEGDWMSPEATERKYRELFIWYKLFSRRGLLRDTPLQKPLTGTLSKLLGYTIPSWHDTHARHRDVT